MSELRLELYVVGHSHNSRVAVENLRRICEKDLQGRCEVEIVDILDNPSAAEDANIVATPTLIRRAPLPIRRIVGDLSATKQVLNILNLDEDHDASD